MAQENECPIDELEAVKSDEDVGDGVRLVDSTLCERRQARRCHKRPGQAAGAPVHGGGIVPKPCYRGFGPPVAGPSGRSGGNCGGSGTVTFSSRGLPARSRRLAMTR